MTLASSGPPGGPLGSLSGRLGGLLGVLYGLSVAVEAPWCRLVGFFGHHKAILEALGFSGRAYVSERCDRNLSRPLGSLFPELRLKAFGEH